METIVQNLQKIEQRIHSACKISNRKRDQVRLLLATKTVNPERIKKAFDAGYTLIAENKIQELKEKYDDLKDYPHTSHFIGHLQTNKVKEILKYNINCIESVDRLKLAQKLQNRLVYEDKTMDVLIQINTSFEESKFGISPENALDLVREVSKLDRIRIKGLMTIGLFSAETEKVRKCFRLLKEIQDQIIQENISNVEMKELSMGMSGDLEVAIEEGSTIVRVGTAVFGKRPYPDSYYWNEEN